MFIRTASVSVANTLAGPRPASVFAIERISASFTGLIR